MAEFTREPDAETLRLLRPFLALVYLPILAVGTATLLAGPASISLRLLAASVLAFLILIALAVQDDHRIRTAQVDRFSPNRALGQFLLACLAITLFGMATDDHLGLARPLLLCALFMAALVGDRIIVTLTWCAAVVGVGVISASVEQTPGELLALCVSYGVAWGVVVLCVRKMVALLTEANARSAALAELSRLAGEQVSWEEGVERLLTLACRATGAEAIAVYAAPQEQPMRLVAESGFHEERRARWPTTARVREVYEGGEPAERENVVLVPAGSEIRWRVVVACRPHTPDDLDLDNAQTVASVLQGLAARVATLDSLRTLASTDELTSLPNRRELRERLGEEMRAARGNGSALSVVIIDLDRFKELNDLHGHLAGDEALREVATSLRERLRGQDTVARVGGEEFCAVLPDTDGPAAASYIDRIRASTRMLRGECVLTFSAGVAEWDGDEPLDALLVRADAALYGAKAAGRDRVELAGRVPSGGRSHS